MRKIRDEIYPNSELVHVSTGITFDGKVVVECKRNLFQEKIKKEYPRLFVPKIKQDDYPGLLPYSFISDDESSGVEVALNRFSYFTEDYPGNKLFIEKATELFDIFKKLYNIGELNKFYWRYIDLIPFAGTRESLPLNNFLKLKIVVPGISNDSLELANMNLELAIKLQGGILKLKLENVCSKDNEQEEAFILITAYEKKSPLNASEFGKYLEEGHKICRKVFEDSITDSYRQYLRGDIV